MSHSPPAIAHVFYAPETRGDPLAAFPALRRRERPYNHWLTEEVLDAILPRWALPEGVAAGPALQRDFAWISHHCRRGFRELLPAALGAGDPALLAALGVTANLQRTAAILAEFLAGGGRLVTGEGPPAALAFRLSRSWCGLADYGADAPYFPARIHPPAHAGRLNARRRDARHLSNALWCSAAAIGARCEEATLRLREAIRTSGIFEPADLQHLRGARVCLRSRQRS